ncbi:MAG: DNA cytosine methyltransferase [Planctomycetaceae bacterium]
MASIEASTNQLIETKLVESHKRGYLRTVDLFAGCGGMTLGFHRAKFKCISAIELDEDARHSHSANFAKHAAPDTYACHSDILGTSPEEAVSHLSPLFPTPEESVDVVIGGPPCQAFSRLGRAALWRLAGKDHAHGEDERATMYEEFLRYVTHLQPIAFVMENVREIGKHVGQNVAEQIALTGEDLGYNVRYTLLNAVWFGVPQLRERAFIVGIHKSLNQVPAFPKIRHRYDLPVGYSTSRAGTGHIEFLEPHDHYVDHHEMVSSPLPAVSVQDAFVDLPPITEHLDGRQGKGLPRDPDSRTPYSGEESDFTRAMRTWPGFQNGASDFSGHVIRYTPRDYEIFRRMPHGGMYPEALEVAEEIFQERLRERERSLRKKIKEHSREWLEIRKQTVPPYKPGRYPNKFRKLWPDHPSRTVPAHIGKDSYSHIHFDSEQARGISLREAARLQAFPDGFQFCGSMNSRLRQIGNAVPPLLAYSVAYVLRRQIDAAARHLEDQGKRKP